MKLAPLSLLGLVLACTPLLAFDYQSQPMLVPPVALPPVTIPQGMHRIDAYHSPSPTPDAGVYAAPIYTVAPPLPLYTNVRYRQERKIHPCAKPMIIEAPNPCYDPCDPCSPKCVVIEVCAPPCEAPCVAVRRHGDKLVYDFRNGYAVNVIVRRDHLVVDYDR